MSRVFHAVAGLLVALWLPATVHCNLEQLGWDALFGCNDTAAAPSPSDDCSDDACATVESGGFSFRKLEFAFLAVAPALARHSDFSVLLVIPPGPAPEISPVRQEQTLPLQRAWRFALRTVAPPRAPDALNA